jgi:hypothetical protein
MRASRPLQHVARSSCGVIQSARSVLSEYGANGRGGIPVAPSLEEVTTPGCGVVVTVYRSCEFLEQRVAIANGIDLVASSGDRGDEKIVAPTRSRTRADRA